MKRNLGLISALVLITLTRHAVADGSCPLSVRKSGSKVILTAPKEFCPSDVVGFLGGALPMGLRFSWGRLFGNLLLLGHDQGSDFCVRSKASEKSRQVDPRWWHKGRELLHEFET